MSWLSTVLSTRASIERIESEVAIDGFISDLCLAGKIELSKEIISAEVEIYLSITRGITVDEANDDVLLDVINNPEVIGLTSDYLTLSVIFEDASMGDEHSPSYIKSKKYYAYYLKQLAIAKQRFNLDTNLDGTVDERRSFHVGTLIR